MKTVQTKNKEEYIKHQEGHVDIGREYGLSGWHTNLIEGEYAKYLISPVLDIGTRNGLFLDKLEEVGITAYGIEITDTAKFAQSMGRKVIQGDIQEKTDWPDKFFKSAVMTHCLEHLDRPVEALKEIKRIVDGPIIICIPIQGENEDYMKEEGPVHGHHTFFESYDDAAKFVVDCGFEILERKDDGIWTMWLVVKSKNE